MKKIAFVFLTLAFITLCFHSCSPKVVPLSGTYPDKNFEAISDNPKDKVWDNIIEYFAKNGISIKLIDRSSGLIISNNTKLISTHEKPKGAGLYNPDAEVVVYKYFMPNDPKFLIWPISGEWNIRIKELPNNKTLVNVNLIIPDEYLVATPVKGTPKGTPPEIGKAYASTGKFENKIFNTIK